MNKVRLNTYSKKRLNFAPFEQPYVANNFYLKSKPHLSKT